MGCRAVPWVCAHRSVRPVFTSAGHDGANSPALDVESRGGVARSVALAQTPGDDVGGSADSRAWLMGLMETPSLDEGHDEETDPMAVQVASTFLGRRSNQPRAVTCPCRRTPSSL